MTVVSTKGLVQIVRQSQPMQLLMRVSKWAGLTRPDQTDGPDELNLDTLFVG